MHLAYAVNTFPALSETFVAREVTALRARGFRVSVYTFRRPSDADVAGMGEEMRALHAEAVLVRPELPGPRDVPELPRLLALDRRLGVGHGSSALGRVGRALGLARRIRADRPDRLHAHWPYATMVTHLASALTGVPYSASVHAHEVAHENGHFAEAFAELDWAAFCNGAAMEHLLVQLPPDARARAHLVYHGVETGRFVPSPMPPAPPLRVVSAGRLTPTKGFDRLVRACAEARDRGAEVELTILGQGDDGARIRAVSRELGFGAHLRMPGWVSHESVGRELAQSHVFALPASTGFHDGLPNVVLEAMASGRPVVLSPLPAAREAVTPGVEGMLLESEHDVDGLADALVSLAADPERLARMGAAARARAAADFDAAVGADRLAELHRGATPESRSRRPGA